MVVFDDSADRTLMMFGCATTGRFQAVLMMCECVDVSEDGWIRDCC